MNAILQKLSELKDMAKRDGRDHRHSIGVVGDWGHFSGANHRLETRYMRLIEMTAITAPLQVNVSTFVLLTALLQFTLDITLSKIHYERSKKKTKCQKEKRGGHYKKIYTEKKINQNIHYWNPLKKIYFTGLKHQNEITVCIGPKRHTVTVTGMHAALGSQLGHQGFRALDEEVIFRGVHDGRRSFQ